MEPREREMTSAWLAMASLMPWRTQLRRPPAWPVEHEAVSLARAGEALEDFDVEERGLRGDADDAAGPGPSGAGGERGCPGAVALLVLRGAVVAGAGEGGLVDFGEVEGEVWGDVGVGGVDAAVEDGDADAGADGGVPGPVAGPPGTCGAEAAGLDGRPSPAGSCRGVGGVCRVSVEMMTGAVDGIGGAVWEVLRAWAVTAVVEDDVDVGLGGEAGEVGGVVVGEVCWTARPRRRCA